MNSNLLLQKRFHSFGTRITFSKAVHAAILAAGFTTAQAQVTLTSDDMFNQTNQYYRAYANSNNSVVSVSGVLGTTGGPQAWDFSSGPQDVTYRFNYIPAAQGPGGADFVSAGAQLAEQKIDEAATTNQSYLYFKQDPAQGRLDYGFYDPTFSAPQPESVFGPPLQDFPNSIYFGQTWSGTTIFYSVISDPTAGDFPERVTFTASDHVDAYGLVTLPVLGFMNCLRVHELAQYDIAVDFGLGGGYESIGTQYVLNYYWLSPGHGIVAQMSSVSPSDGSQPPDNLSTGATSFVRMFALNHPTGGGGGTTPTIKGFKITMGSSSALLQWTLLSGVTSYRVDYATNFGGTPNWQSLGTTTSNFMLDSGAPAAAHRFYRVVGTLGP
jgi:hypothetical protein